MVSNERRWIACLVSAFVVQGCAVEPVSQVRLPATASGPESHDDPQAFLGLTPATSCEAVDPHVVQRSVAAGRLYALEAAVTRKEKGLLGDGITDVADAVDYDAPRALTPHEAFGQCGVGAARAVQSLQDASIPAYELTTGTGMNPPTNFDHSVGIVPRSDGKVILIDPTAPQFEHWNGGSIASAMRNADGGGDILDTLFTDGFVELDNKGLRTYLEAVNGVPVYPPDRDLIQELADGRIRMTKDVDPERHFRANTQSSAEEAATASRQANDGAKKKYPEPPVNRPGIPGGSIG
jgi:hypothetical protein